MLRSTITYSIIAKPIGFLFGMFSKDLTKFKKNANPNNLKIMFFPTNDNNGIVFIEWIMKAITRANDFVSRAVGEWRNSSERVISVIRE
jgi:hypothetical protein